MASDILKLKEDSPDCVFLEKEFKDEPMVPTVLAVLVTVMLFFKEFPRQKLPFAITRASNLRNVQEASPGAQSISLFES